MDTTALKAYLVAFYDAHIAAGWYRASSIVVGWFVSAVMFLPNILDFVANNWAGLAGLVVPKWSPETQALVMGLYVSFVAPPLRAWAQKKIRQAVLKQAVKTGQVSSDAGTDAVTIAVPGVPAVEVAPAAPAKVQPGV